MQTLKSLSELPSETPQVALDSMPGLVDVLYFDEDRQAYDTVRANLLKIPDLVIKDASDGIHGLRLEVECKPESQDSYYKFICSKELFTTSLQCGLMRYSVKGTVYLMQLFKSGFAQSTN